MFQITQQLCQTIVNQLDVYIAPEELSADTQLMGEGLALDSIAIIELITVVEDEFDIMLSEDDLDMEKFSTVGSLSALIADKKTPITA